MARVISWMSDDEIRSNLGKRLANAKQARSKLENEWSTNERIIYSTTSALGLSGDSLVSAGNGQTALQVDQDEAPSYTMNYAFKNLRLVHSKLAANPPSVVPRPTSNDPSDRRKADAADRLIRYALRQYDMKEVHDQCALLCLLHGTGFIKSCWDADAGDILEFDEETGEVTTEGDMHFGPRSVWQLWLDPDATCWKEVNYVFERILMPYEEACYRFPDKKDLLQRVRIQQDTARQQTSTSSPMEREKYDVVELFQYWERGAPFNGMVGRFAWCLGDGTPISKVMPNPYRFSVPVDKGISHPEDKPIKKEQLSKAGLPYHVFTDVDVPGTVYGKASVSYQAPLQTLHNDILNASVDMLQAHGVARIVLPEGTEIADGSITNSNWDVIKMTGSVPPHFMAPLPMPQSMPELLDRAKMGVDDMAGVNESMFGQQSREQSGYSMQYATQQGDMIRHRLFVKYTKLVEDVYKAYLNMVRKYWNTEHTIHVLGKEKAFEALDIQGADIEGGFDLVVEYGTSVSLDPVARKQEILTLMPVFEKAGMSPRSILSMLKMNELDGLLDRVQMANDRQREIFEKMVKTGVYEAPRKIADHVNMLAYAYDFIMGAEFLYLDEEHKKLIERHIEEREAIAATGPVAQGTTPSAENLAAAAPMPAMP